MARVRRPSNLTVAAKTPKAFVLIAVIAIAAAGYFIYQHSQGGGDETASDAATPSTDRSSAHYAPAIGPVDAPVVLAKWTDFQ